MGGDFYIGAKRKRSAEKKKKGGTFRTILLLFFCTALLLAFLLNAILLPQVKGLCSNALSNRLEALASRSAYELLSRADYGYGDFVRLAYDTSGAVRAATVDTVKINLLKTRLSLTILEALTQEQIAVSVPMGNLLGLVFFSGRGENVWIKAQVSEGMRARFHTEFTEAGINQTRHAIGFSLNFTAFYFLASKKETLSFSVNIPIGETLIVGDVPDSLTQINRLSDEITEIEIDDAVDFGDVVS